MKPLKSGEISGVWASILLPLKPDESIDYKALENQIEYLSQSGVDGVYSNGTAAEFFSQSEDEFERITEILADACERNGCDFQVGAGHPGTGIMAKRVRTAVKYCPGAIQVILPDWVPLSDKETVDFLNRMVELADGIGIVLYNPPHAKRVLTPGDYERLLCIQGLVGIKTGAGNAAWYQEMKGVFRQLSVFCPGHSMATALQGGAAGSYSNMACLSPKGAVKWYHLMQRDMARALQWQQCVARFMSDVMRPLTGQEYPGFVKDKLMAAAGGWCAIHNRVRSPYHYPPLNVVEHLRDGAMEHLPMFMEENAGTAKGDERQ